MHILRWVTFLVAGLFLSSPILWAAIGAIDTTFNSPDGYALWDGGNGYDRGRDIAI